jgi:radical SAM protein with 4Fe4S-binding SPASM domain
MFIDAILDTAESSTVVRLTIRNKVPFYVFFELTRQCNLSCSYCYVVRERRQELSTSEIRDTLDQLKKEKCLIVNFSGGEVFTRKDFFDIAWEAKDKGFVIKIFTNGTLIDEERAKEIARLKPLRVEITVLSTDDYVHDTLTSVRGSLRASLLGLRLLAKRRVPLRIKCTLMKQNIAGYKHIISLAEQLGAKYQFNPLLLPRTNGMKTPCRFQVGEKGLRQFFRDPKISKLEKGEPRRPKRDARNLLCSAAHNSCAITAYGDIWPCIAFPIRSGNLREKSFSEIWHNSSLLRKCRSMRLKDLKNCMRCELYRYCNRCPGNIYLKKGNLYAISKRDCMIASFCRESVSGGNVIP